MGRIRKRWNDRFLGADAAAVFVVATVIAIIGSVPQLEALFDGLSDSNRANLYKTTATIAGTMMALTLPVSALIIGHWRQSRLRLIREARKPQTQLWKTIHQTTGYLFLLLIVSMVLLMVDGEIMPFRYALPTYVLFAGLAVVRLLRTIWILQNITMVIITDRDDDQNPNGA